MKDPEPFGSGSVIIFGLASADGSRSQSFDIGGNIDHYRTIGGKRLVERRGDILCLLDADSERAHVLRDLGEVCLVVGPEFTRAIVFRLVGVNTVETALGLVAAAGHEQHLDSRTKGLHQIRQFAARHAVHHDIAHYQMNRVAGVGGGEGSGSGGTTQLLMLPGQRNTKGTSKNSAGTGMFARKPAGSTPAPTAPTPKPPKATPNPTGAGPAPSQPPIAITVTQRFNRKSKNPKLNADRTQGIMALLKKKTPEQQAEADDDE